MPKQTQGSVEFAHADQKIEDEMRVVRKCGFQDQCHSFDLAESFPLLPKV